MNASRSRVIRIRGLALGCLSVMTCAGRSAAIPQTQNPATWHDPSPHSTRFVTVDTNVKLEVLDWGGTGPSLVLLTGLGNTAHVFDDFAPKLTDRCHVYGITRRGFGASTSPSSGYSADRLGDDIVAVLDTLKIDRPVLVGHSIAGEELSSIGTRHPQRVAGLIYLEAGYAYAYYDPSLGDFDLDSQELQRKLKSLQSSSAEFKKCVRELQAKLTRLNATEIPREKKRLVLALLQTDLPQCRRELRSLQQNMESRQASERPQDAASLIGELLRTDLPVFERDLQALQEYLESAPQPDRERAPTAADLASFSALNSWMTRVEGLVSPESELRQHYAVKPNGAVGKERDFSKAADAIAAGGQKYADIRVPILAVYSLPQDKENSSLEEAQAKAFEKGISLARVVWVPHANHYVFFSNEADVLREMHAFLDNLLNEPRGQQIARPRNLRSNSRLTLPAQPVDATPSNLLIRQYFPRENRSGRLYSIKP